MVGNRQDLALAKGFLARFARDTRANTLAIMAMAIIPLAGMVGGGIDISRMYIVKTRLQHGCDAGALAGRKAMGGGNWTQTVKGVANYPRTTANQFFDSNFDENAYGGTNPTRSFTESAGKVTGTASAIVPMTLMRIFGRTSETLTVSCQADMRLPNTDVMFVLDTTGSMASKANGKSCDATCLAAGDSKMQNLRYAVKCFYEIVSRLATTADCGDDPSGGVGSLSQIRFGFVPYSTNVNVGRLLPSEYFQDNPLYQTRKLESVSWDYPKNGTPSATSTETKWGNASGWTDKGFEVSASKASACANPRADSTPTNNGASTTTQLSVSENDGVRTVTYKVDQPIIKTQYSYDSFSSGKCRYDTRTVPGTTTTYYTRNDAGVATPTWRYGQFPQSIVGLKNGSNWNNSFQLRLADGYKPKTISWAGCIEEADTVRQTSFSSIPNSAFDLDINLVPSSDAQRWRPALPGLVWLRNATTTGSTTTTDWSTNQSVTSTNYKNNVSSSCPSAAHKLDVWNAPDFEDYVDDLTASGATYHDIGLLWGARLISPTGLFASENALTPGGGEIERHIVFMTDGTTNANATDYAAYGLPWFDRRQTDPNNVPSKDELDDQVDMRFAALCTSIKNLRDQNDKVAVTLWVISFGTDVDQATKTRMKNCATSTTYFFDAPDKPTLLTAFRSIANQISALRLTN
ncbi:TadE/TadG family type IV pilus assembly protein [Sphingomonas sp. HF-S4]|uniref:TadE/TadG family type IV pilus assembly protein n=1 Tax=Sphingomonas agrestis TaxID=3080540 RepID=A0ABU3Y5M4_9SPHN|nr:TadE/TadG family type IV pilus assembly protein [Sphingomonas sp. HF-S4]MDV3456703.1 TadE/TadG family type IV pilus assembly protein [Sphingomonas sp. HF-S4]